MSSELDYAGQLLRALPQGWAWSQNRSTRLAKLLQAIADEFCRIEDRSKVATEVEAFPDTATELLAEWESFLGLPGSCDTIANSLEQRRADLVAKLVNRVGQSPAYFVELAASLGFTVSAIIEYRPFECGRSVCGDALSGGAWVFAWTVTAPEFSPQFFQIGSSGMGDPLVSVDNSRLTCVFEELKPAHSIVLFDFSGTYIGYAPWETIAPDPLDFSIDSPELFIV